MITRVQQGRAIARRSEAGKKPKLSALEKAMLRWATVDPEDKVLDVGIGEGLMAEYLRRNMQCEVCGVSDRMEDVRLARGRLRSCDIVYAAAGDIPWREHSFDTVFMRLAFDDADALKRTLAEAHRVLKNGGQLLLGTKCYPTAVRALFSQSAEDEAETWRSLRRQEMLQMLSELRFENLSWQRSGLVTGVLIGWKQKPAEDEAGS